MSNPKECFRNMCDKTDRWFPNFWKINQKELDTIEKALDEHEQHKAIEQELGIDLITLFKAISDGVWVKTKNDISKHLTVALKKRHHTKEYWLFYRPYSHVYLKDYGKTWALTKEELEK